MSTTTTNSPLTQILADAIDEQRRVRMEAEQRLEEAKRQSADNEKDINDMH